MLPRLVRLAGLLFLGCRIAMAADPRPALVKAILSENPQEQAEIILKLAESGEPIVAQVLSAWRQSGVFLYETNDLRIPFVFDSQMDGLGKAKAVAILDGKPIVDGSGAPVMLLPADLTAVDTSSKLRKVIKTTLDLFAISDPDPKLRRDAVIKLGQAQNQEYLPNFQARLAVEKDPVTLKSLKEAVALTQVASPESSIRIPAIRTLGEGRSITSLTFLKQLQAATKKDPQKWDEGTKAAVNVAVREIEEYIQWGELFGTAFRGLSLSAVLLVAALGLAITFGLMGVINMAHGEIIMVGAYTAYVVQNIFKSWFGASGTGFDLYFIAALAASFVTAGLTGLILERGIIRFLYKRPLESLLATWGVSLILQQIFRHIFGAANVQVSSPSWLNGSFIVSDVLLAYNRVFVIGFAALTVFGTYLLLTRTSLGLQIRAVMQNRAMASCLGVRTDRVNMMTFAFGSGLAGMAGACLAQIGNVGPSLGQNYIIDCFMVVVLGGVGNIVGTVVASFGIGVTDQVLQPWVGAVMGKITVLGAIILFLQWRPAGLFVTRTRNLEG